MHLCNKNSRSRSKAYVKEIWIGKIPTLTLTPKQRRGRSRKVFPWGDKE